MSTHAVQCIKCVLIMYYIKRDCAQFPYVMYPWGKPVTTVLPIWPTELLTYNTGLGIACELPKSTVQSLCDMCFNEMVLQHSQSRKSQTLASFSSAHPTECITDTWKWHNADVTKHFAAITFVTKLRLCYVSFAFEKHILSRLLRYCARLPIQ